MLRRSPPARTYGRRYLAVESLESRQLLASLPYGALPQDTGEYMLGKIAVTPVLLESNGQVDANTENWTPTLIQSALQTVEKGVDWWVDLLAKQNTKHSLEFVLNTTYATNPAPTRYEPISRPSNDYGLWVQEFLVGAGFSSSSSMELNMRAFNDAQRQKLGTDWAFTIFVVNSTADADGQFAPNGSFSRAFGFAGGLFFISPSTRPASTFTHETGHIFWAKDEYAGGAAYTDKRGYYNTQNTNAADNPAPGFVQQPSIMAAGTVLQSAYDDLVSPASTLAMIGWQDSDGDGIFDVLDVPLELTGSGVYDPTAKLYKFQGFAKVGVLPNLNSEGLRNDISLNRISLVEYRVDNGNWTTVAQPNTYEFTLDLSIPIAQAGQVIEIRARDAQTSITSNVFQGRFDRSDAVRSPGINGAVWIDTNKNGTRDSGEVGAAGWNVELLSSAGQTLNLRKQIEPDQLPDGDVAAAGLTGVTISAIGSDSDGRVGVFSDSEASTGTKTFRAFSRAAQSWLQQWNQSTRRLRVDLSSATSVVQIDAIGAVDDAYGRLEAYDASGKLLDRFTTTKLSNGQSATMRVESAIGNIAYVIAGGQANSIVRLDNLQYGPKTVGGTQPYGQYVFEGLPTGNYQVRVTPPVSTFAPLVSGGNQIAASATAGEITLDRDLGFQSTASAWQNPRDRFDVTNNQSVSALDVLQIVNEINRNGTRELARSGLTAPPYLDVNGDGYCTALDALQVVNWINSRGSGEGEMSSLATPVSGQLASPAATTQMPPEQTQQDLTWLAAWNGCAENNDPLVWLEVDNFAELSEKS